MRNAECGKSKAQRNGLISDVFLFDRINWIFLKYQNYPVNPVKFFILKLNPFIIYFLTYKAFQEFCKGVCYGSRKTC
jgi:hypothetical protein